MWQSANSHVTHLSNNCDNSVTFWWPFSRNSSKIIKIKKGKIHPNKTILQRYLIYLEVSILGWVSIFGTKMTDFGEISWVDKNCKKSGVQQMMRFLIILLFIIIRFRLICYSSRCYQGFFHSLIIQNRKFYRRNRKFYRRNRKSLTSFVWLRFIRVL